MTDADGRRSIAPLGLALASILLVSSLAFSIENAPAAYTAAAAASKVKCGEGDANMNAQCLKESAVATYSCSYPGLKPSGKNKGALCMRGAPCGGKIKTGDVIQGTCASPLCCKAETINGKPIGKGKLPQPKPATPGSPTLPQLPQIPGAGKGSGQGGAPQGGQSGNAQARLENAFNDLEEDLIKRGNTPEKAREILNDLLKLDSSPQVQDARLLEAYANRPPTEAEIALAKEIEPILATFSETDPIHTGSVSKEENTYKNLQPRQIYSYVDNNTVPGNTFVSKTPPAWWEAFPRSDNIEDERAWTGSLLGRTVINTQIAWDSFKRWLNGERSE